MPTTMEHANVGRLDHPSNMYDDTSLVDIAESMRDMISVASDPTAAGGDGLNVEIFQASPGNLNTSISYFSESKFSLHSKDPTKSAPITGSPALDKPVLTNESAYFLSLVDSLPKIPMETSAAKSKVSPSEEHGKTSRGKPLVQRARPPMEYIEENKYVDGEDGVASLGVESVVNHALEEQKGKGKKERPEKKERWEKKERLVKQKRQESWKRCCPSQKSHRGANLKLHPLRRRPPAHRNHNRLVQTILTISLREHPRPRKSKVARRHAPII